MLKISPSLNYINDTFSEARELGIINHVASQENYSGRILEINGKSLVNFITCNYLAFDNDQRVKDAAIEGIEKFGIHASVSRTYLTFDHYVELEEKLEKIFGLPTYLANCTTLGHFAYLPVIIGRNDAVIMDQFVHRSVQMAVQYLKGDGYYAETIRHNDMSALESRIKELRNNYDRVWYLADSVYSMHGDVAPLSDVEQLLNSYEQFHCYMDDAHGISWIGEHGKGFLLHKMQPNEKMFIITSLNKGFGAFSSALVFPNQEVKNLVKNCGSPLIFSTPTLHAGITAASRLADIHLSEEIYEKQMQLNILIKHFKQRAKEFNLPIVSYTHTPVFYVGLGSLDHVFNFTKHLINQGFLLSAASVPSVPYKQSGLRIFITLHQTLQDVDNLIVEIASYMEDLERKGLFNREEALKGFKGRSKELEIA